MGQVAGEDSWPPGGILAAQQRAGVDQLPGRGIRLKLGTIWTDSWVSWRRRNCQNYLNQNRWSGDRPQLFWLQQLKVALYTCCCTSCAILWEAYKRISSCINHKRSSWMIPSLVRKLSNFTSKNTRLKFCNFSNRELCNTAWSFATFPRSLPHRDSSCRRVLWTNAKGEVAKFSLVGKHLGIGDPGFFPFTLVLREISTRDKLRVLPHCTHEVVTKTPCD
jgi:hypothetical protein